MKNKINISFVIIGVLVVIIFILLVKFTYTSRDIRLNGEIIQCPIISITYAIKGGNHGHVMINNKEFHVGRLTDDLEVGDTIKVRFMEGKSQVVQADIKPEIYYLYFGLESIVLILGIILIIGGFQGKSIYDSSTSKKINIKNKFGGKKHYK